MSRGKLPVGEKRSEMIFALLRPRERRELDKVAQQADLSRSVVVRKAINEFVARHGSEKEIAADG